MYSTSKIKRILAAIYFIWLFLHVGLLFYAEDSSDSQQFWPFIKAGQTMQHTYDAFEFLIYVGVPLVLYIALKMIFVKKDEEYYSPRKHSASGSYFIAFLNEKIKVEELTQKINSINNQPVDNSKLEALKHDLKTVSSHGVEGWLDRVAVRKKYKDYQT